MLKSPGLIASMRPRVFPAEDVAAAEGDAGLSATASMRPRVFPAEDGFPNAAKSGNHSRFNEAAGIPRGRLQGSRRSREAMAGCFNEAAGIPRGRRAQDDSPAERACASMRPRVFPAEDRSPEMSMS